MTKEKTAEQTGSQQSGAQNTPGQIGSDDLKQAYKERGFQKMTLAEYEALQTKLAKKQKRKIPKPIKIIFSAIMLVIFVLGLIVIPMTLFQVATGKSKKQKNVTDKGPKILKTAVREKNNPG